MRGDECAGDLKPHILYRNGLWRCYTLVWVGRYSTGIRLGLGHTIDAAFNRWLDGTTLDSGRNLYTMKL